MIILQAHILIFVLGTWKWLLYWLHMDILYGPIFGDDVHDWTSERSAAASVLAEEMKKADARSVCESVST